MLSSIGSSCSGAEAIAVASLQQDDSGNYHIYFRYGGRQFHKSLKTADQQTAEATKGASN